MFRAAILLTCLLAATAHAQQVPGTADTGGYRLISPAVEPNLSPGVVLLLELEQKFAADVATHGGKAFGTWFADDAVTLANGKPAVLGRGAIAAEANWDPAVYSLTWQPQGAQMSAANDMGFTWGLYTGTTRTPSGETVTSSGRYLTIWRKLPNGSWKVALDASATGPAEAGSCCTVPAPGTAPAPSRK